MVARATFTTMKQGVTHSLLDHLFLEIICYDNSHAFQTLASMMESWQLYQLRMRVDQSIKNTDEFTTKCDPELYYATFLERLMDRYSDVVRITSLHALHMIASDHTTATSAVLESFGVTSERLERALVESKVASDDSTTIHTQHLPVVSYSAEPTPQSEKHVLSKFGVELTQLAREGRIDPVVGRESEIERVTHILSRRKKNNPMLIGEAGVGKSSVVEGLALRIVEGNVPHSLLGKRLFALDISALVAGTKFRGDFEERMTKLLDELKDDNDTILFIDEIHTIVGAGSSQGSLDVANILKPALSRGELQTIGATTLDEYREDIEVDAALVRRFQTVMVAPTTEDQTLEILRNIAPTYESHHHVKYSEEALRACVSLSVRYLADRHLPDKAIDLMDEAGTFAHLSPAEIAEIGEAEIEKVVTMITGIPAERISTNEVERLRALSDHLNSIVIGQTQAVESIVRTIKRSRAGLRDENRPIGNFIFVGSTGVGKTRLAKELAAWMFEGRQTLLRLDMSEYSQPHSVSRLIGSPPGYVGYSEGGQLTEPIRREPYSVVLFDEIEKAHPDVYNLMLQLLDEGQLTDGTGRRVDFRNTIIIMTSNLGARKAANVPAPIGFNASAKPRNSSREVYESTLRSYFPPEFLNRVDDIVIFNDLSMADIKLIVDTELRATIARVERLGYIVEVTPEARQELAQMGYDRSFGARSLRRTIVEHIEEPISNLIIEEQISRGDKIVITKATQRLGVEVSVAKKCEFLA